MRHLLILGALAALATPAYAAPCRDAKGHFIKCPTAAVSSGDSRQAKPRCRDAKGHFAKCPAK